MLPPGVPGTGLPPFCKAPGPNVTPQDLEAMRAHGAFALPGAALQDALLDAYVCFVHPMLPIVDLAELLGVVARGDGGAGQISLMVYQAVLLAASPYVGARELQGDGFDDNRAALEVLFQRAKALYEHHYESDALAIVQTTLLMTFSFEARHNTTNSWHWMGIAISYAHNIGLHIDPETFGFEPSARGLRRRVWWACFMQDQMIALATRQPPRISRDDFSTRMLQERDFQVLTAASASPSPSSLARWFPRLLTPNAQRDLALLCVDKTRLCLLASRIFREHYTALYKDAESLRASDLRALMLYPKPPGPGTPSPAALDDELAAWSSALPPFMQQSPAMASSSPSPSATSPPTVPSPAVVSSPTSSSSAPLSVVDVHCYALCLLYRSVTLALHRPEAQGPSTGVRDRWYPLLRSRAAANEITRMLGELRRSGAARSLPVVAIITAIPAAVIHICDIKDALPGVDRAATQRYWTCVGVLEDLSSVYTAAPHGIAFLNAAYVKVTGDAMLASKYLSFDEATTGEVPGFDLGGDLLASPSGNLLETWYDVNAGAMGSEDGMSLLAGTSNVDFFAGAADGQLEFPSFPG